MTRIIRDIRFGTRGNFFNSRSPQKIIIRDSQVPSCLRLAPLPAPVHYVIGHRVRVREHCSRLSCIQSGLPTGRLDRDRPSRTSAPRTMAEVTELVRQTVEPRLTIESFPSRPPAPQRRSRRRSRYKSRLDLRAHIRTYTYVPNNS